MSDKTLLAMIKYQVLRTNFNDLANQSAELSEDLPEQSPQGHSLEKVHGHLAGRL